MNFNPNPNNESIDTATEDEKIALNHHKVNLGKKFQCPKCEYRTTRKDALQSHMKTHTSEKPYLCDRCGKSFKTKQKLMLHLDHYLSHEDRKARRKKPFKCCHCRKLYKLERFLKIHEKECKNMLHLHLFNNLHAAKNRPKVKIGVQKRPAAKQADKS